MSRRILLLCGLLPVLAFPTIASANDASMVRALSPYRGALQNDILLLAAFNSPPSKGAAPSFITKLSRAQRDMNTVARIMRAQSPSTANGRKAQSNVLVGLSDAYAAAGDGLAAVNAVKSNKIAQARSDIAREQSYVAKSIPYFSAAAKALGIFTG
jgi:hypothetical protein